MKTFSIRRRLAVLILGSVLLVWLAMLISGYDEAREELNELADAHLEENARTLALLDLEGVKALAGAVHGKRESHGKEHMDGHGEGHDKHIGFQIWNDGGNLLAHSAGVPDAAFDPRGGHAVLTISGKNWHSYAMRNEAGGYQVRVFEAARMRDEVVNDSAIRMGEVLLLALPVLALLVWFSVGRGLRPLKRLSQALASRDAGNLEPVSLEKVPAETLTLVQSLNQLLQRLSQSFDRERAFTADAAHELRTPLAAIKVQAEVALAATDEQARRQAIGQVIAGVNRTTRLAQQLLLLARIEQPPAAQIQAVDLGEAAAASVARFADEAMRKGLEPGLAATPGCIVPADPEALAMLVDNLLDNAVKYASPGGHVAVSVEREHGRPVLRVRDDGPGVPPEDWPRLTGRFFRVLGSRAEGSGLGLSLVERIARQYGGEVSFSTGLDGRGLGVTVRFGDVGQARA